MPRIPLRRLLPIAAFALLMLGIQLGALSVAFEKLGLSPDSVMLLFLTLLGGSVVNLPLFSMKSEPPRLDDLPPRLRKLFHDQMPHTGRTLVLVNVGGCVVPVAFSLYLLTLHSLNIFHVVLAVAAVAMLCFKITRPMPGIGLGGPILVAPLAAALVSIALDPANAAPLAFISGTLGVLVGADLLHLDDIRRLGTPFASIGGAGSFDGIFISGLVAVLLA